MLQIVKKQSGYSLAYPVLRITEKLEIGDWVETKQDKTVSSSRQMCSHHGHKQDKTRQFCLALLSGVNKLLKITGLHRQLNLPPRTVAWRPVTRNRQRLQTEVIRNVSQFRFCLDGVQ